MILVQRLAGDSYNKVKPHYGSGGSRFLFRESWVGRYKINLRARIVKRLSQLSYKQLSRVQLPV